MSKKQFFTLLFCIIFSQLFSQNNIPEKNTIDTLKVGVKISPPFIMKSEDGSFTGVSIDLWKRIEKKLGVESRFYEYNLKGLLNSIETRQVDLSINPLTVTSERLERIDFTQPFFTAKLAIAINAETENGVLIFIKNFFSVQFFSAIFLLFLVILIFGLIIWLSERKKNPGEFHKGIRGIGHGIWWSAVTMTTVGYGDKSPKTLTGRIIGIVWMFTSVIIISGLTGSIAASLTAQKTSLTINSLEDLYHASVGTVAGSNSAQILLQKNIKFKKCKNIKEAMRLLENQELEAVLYDEPILTYLVNKKDLSEQIIITPIHDHSQYFSFSFPHGHQLTDTINYLLLNELESVRWKAIINQYDLNQ